MTPTVIDRGLELAEGMARWAEAHSVPLVPGDIREMALTVVDLESFEEPDELSRVLSLLEKAAPFLIVVSRLDLDRTTIEETVSRLERRGGHEAEIDDARACESFIGHIAHLDISIFVRGGPVVLKYYYFAPWYGEASGRSFDDEDEDSQDLSENVEWREEQAERAKWTPAARSAAARRVASDPRFPKAKNEAGRVLITRDVLGEDVPTIEHIVKEIGREAKAIFELDFKGRA